MTSNAGEGYCQRTALNSNRARISEARWTRSRKACDRAQPDLPEDATDPSVWKSSKDSQHGAFRADLTVSCPPLLPNGTLNTLFDCKSTSETRLHYPTRDRARTS